MLWMAYVWWSLGNEAEERSQARLSGIDRVLVRVKAGGFVGAGVAFIVAGSTREELAAILGGIFLLVEAVGPSLVGRVARRR